MTKRISFIMLVLFICIIFYACSNQRDLSSDETNNLIVATANKEREISISNERHDIREIAYNQLICKYPFLNIQSYYLVLKYLLLGSQSYILLFQ